jgi:hypothetical protein
MGSRFIAVVLAAACLAACSDPAPPVGRWQGSYEGDGAIIVARLEIAPGGVIRVSAPNAFADMRRLTSEERERIRAQLDLGLAAGWAELAPLAFEFDGKTFRKPGGVAPQMEWNDARKEMTLVVYPGLMDTIRVKLDAVESFGQSGS